MRHEKAEHLLRLCLMMTARTLGVSIDDICQEFSVSRRTAERMRDAALRLMPDVQEETDYTGYKRWRANSGLKDLIHFSAEDVATVSSAAEMMRQQSRQDAADLLENLSLRLLASQSKKRQFRLEPDIELLLQSEGIALRPGPRVAVPVEYVHTIRDGILRSLRIEVTHTKRLTGETFDAILEPYGLLYGQRPYLVARPAGKTDLRHYRLQGLQKVSLTENSFIRDEGFDLATYGRRLFGVFNEEPFDVCWLFRPQAAADAAEYVFHPDQTLLMRPDGSLEVRFRAGGALEMAWHLLTWGDAVEVIEPADFWQRMEINRERIVQKKP